MLIKEICRLCGLTKKAVEYYEAKGLVHPGILENGYRDYSETEIAALKELSVLRRCGLGISEIKAILGSGNKRAALEKYKYLSELKMQRLAAIQKCMDSLIEDYNIDREFDCLSSRSEDTYTIKERLVYAFPGNYGLFLSLHFGRFLDGFIDTEEKRRAYDEIISYLDNVDLFLSDDLSDFLEEALTLNEGSSIKQLENGTNTAMSEMLEDVQAYLEKISRILKNTMLI